MLTCKIGNKKFNSFEVDKEKMRKLSNKGILKCPITDQKVIYRHGKIKIPHFAYKFKPDVDFGFWENESKEHYLGKIYIYKWLKNQNTIEKLELEKWIPETKQIADIYFEQFGKKYVIEYQCSNTTLDKYLERSFLYSTIDINDIWIFGTENFNVGKIKGRTIGNRNYHGEFKNMKLSLKALESDRLGKDKYLYHFDSINKIIYKSFEEPYVFIFKDKIKTDENLFFDNGEIYLPIEINTEWNKNMDNYLKEHKRCLYEKSKKENLYRRWLKRFNDINELVTILKIDPYEMDISEVDPYYKIYMNVNNSSEKSDLEWE